ncbi:hypothetical protein RvY_17659 [Ramazzottius varieornatus]|uniref:Uncharacterized protein n=1 Tax=Ramazzottius varieornatus TaxID=947166 RepID=A0A1D1W2X9_RAMVA|nr:hypothetical protein RvY_17659 [Ramazzottius varieornatus]
MSTDFGSTRTREWCKEEIRSLLVRWVRNTVLRRGGGMCQGIRKRGAKSRNLEAISFRKCFVDSALDAHVAAILILRTLHLPRPLQQDTLRENAGFAVAR